MPVEQFIDDGCGCDPNVPEGEVPIEAYDEQLLQQTGEQNPAGSPEAASTDSAAGDQVEAEAIERLDASQPPMPSLLKRFANWLSVSNQTQS